MSATGTCLSLKIKRGRGRRYPEARDLAEFVDQFLGHPVGERLLVHLFGQVEKRQHRDRFLWLPGDGGRVCAEDKARGKAPLRPPT
jgi:hypothetical protein